MAVRARLIDRLRQLLSEDLRDLIDRNIVLGRQLPNGIVAEHLLQFFRRDRQVLAVAEPGLDLIAEPRLLKLGDNGGQAALAATTKEFVQYDRQHGAPELAECASEFGEFSSELRIPMTKTFRVGSFGIETLYRRAVKAS